MDKRRLLYLLLVVAFFLGVVLVIVGGVLYWHYHTGNSHSGFNLDQVNSHSGDYVVGHRLTFEFYTMFVECHL